MVISGKTVEPSPTAKLLGVVFTAESLIMRSSSILAVCFRWQPQVDLGVQGQGIDIHCWPHSANIAVSVYPSVQGRS